MGRSRRRPALVVRPEAEPVGLTGLTAHLCKQPLQQHGVLVTLDVVAFFSCICSAGVCEGPTHLRWHPTPEHDADLQPRSLSVLTA